MYTRVVSTVVKYPEYSADAGEGGENEEGAEEDEVGKDGRDCMNGFAPDGSVQEYGPYDFVNPYPTS